jgi:hypothetical protein
MSKKNRNNNATVNNQENNNPAPEKPAETPEKKTGIKEKAKAVWNSKPVRIGRKVIVYGAAAFGLAAGTAIAVDARAARKANPGMDEGTGYHNDNVE